MGQWIFSSHRVFSRRIDGDGLVGLLFFFCFGGKGVCVSECCTENPGSWPRGIKSQGWLSNKKYFLNFNEFEYDTEWRFAPKSAKPGLFFDYLS